MGRIMGSVGTIIGKMFRALLIWGIVIGGGAIAGVALLSHHAPLRTDWVLIAVLAVVGGVLGSMMVLVWEMSHMGQISRAIRSRQGPHGPNQSPTYPR